MLAKVLVTLTTVPTLLIYIWVLIKRVEDDWMLNNANLKENAVNLYVCD
jgi:hypothetical protein